MTMNYAIHYYPAGTFSECVSCPFDTIAEAVAMVERLYKERELNSGCSIYNINTNQAELYFEIWTSGEIRWVDAVARYRIKTWEYYFRNRDKIRAKAYQKQLAEVEAEIARAERKRERIQQELKKLGL